MNPLGHMSQYCLGIEIMLGSSLLQSKGSLHAGPEPQDSAHLYCWKGV